MLITLSSTTHEPYRFSNHLKEPLVIEKDSKIALIACYLNKKREIDIPQSVFTIVAGEDSRDIQISARTLTDTAPFCTWLTNRLNQDADIMNATFKVGFEFSYGGFQVSWITNIPQDVSFSMSEGLHYAMGYANTTYGTNADVQSGSFFSEISVGSTNNQNAIMVHMRNLPIKSYNANQGTMNSILGTIPLTNTKSSALNYNMPHLFYLKLRNSEQLIMHSFDVVLTYTDGTIVEDLAPDSTIVLSIE